MQQYKDPKSAIPQYALFLLHINFIAGYLWLNNLYILYQGQWFPADAFRPENTDHSVYLCLRTKPHPLTTVFPLWIMYIFL